ncbi:hypothetical protein SNEBB_006673 [Seison nebaliae]|nr:hypothetical protein SNEBB_006673 [Seison nebaliae]
MRDFYLRTIPQTVHSRIYGNSRNAHPFRVYYDDPLIMSSENANAGKGTIGYNDAHYNHYGVLYKNRNLDNNDEEDDELTDDEEAERDNILAREKNCNVMLAQLLASMFKNRRRPTNQLRRDVRRFRDRYDSSGCASYQTACKNWKRDFKTLRNWMSDDRHLSPKQKKQFTYRLDLYRYSLDSEYCGRD